MPMAFWLMKSEPSEVSVDDLAARPDRRIGWFGVRNYQARNLMRDMMKEGDTGFFYHSSCPAPGIVGVVRICREAHPDPTQFDSEGRYFDPKATREAPRWVQVEVELVQKTRLVSLEELKTTPGLEGMMILRRGNRLSVSPLTDSEARIILGLGGGSFPV